MTKDLVYDVGMNNGDDSAYYLHRGFRVVAVEAHPGMVAGARERFREEIKAGRLILVPAAIAGSAGTRSFWVCESQPEWSSFDRGVASRDGAPCHEVEVPCRTFESVLDEFGVPYYLKIDIEGSDPLCVLGLRPGDVPRYLSLEVGDDSLSLLPHLVELGYERFKIVSQFHYLPMERPPSSEEHRFVRLESLRRGTSPFLRLARRLGLRRWIEQRIAEFRRRGDWTFPRGSSGPFGEETPGRWLRIDELDEVRRYYEAARRESRPTPFWDVRKDYSFWADLHARHGPG